MLTPKPSRERVAVVLEDEGNAVPFNNRLRRLLKNALRAYGIRCRWIQDAAGWTFGDKFQQTEPLDIGAQNGPAA